GDDEIIALRRIPNFKFQLTFIEIGISINTHGTSGVARGTDFVFDIELTSDSISEIVLDDYINAEGGVSFSDSFDLATAVRIMSEAGLFPNGESTMLVRFGNQVASIAAAPIPLPGAIAFMITGLAGMGWVRKKKST
ncbi:MAG: hypothetical protein AAF723_04480, partial [Pseudomonadota bacterium]